MSGTTKSTRAIQHTTWHKETFELKTPPPLMTEAERDRYRRFLAAAEEKLARDRHHLTKLRARWQRSGAIADGVTPRGVATLYSQVRIRDMKSGRTHVQTVVLPTDAEVRAYAGMMREAMGDLINAGPKDRARWHASLKLAPPKAAVTAG